MADQTRHALVLAALRLFGEKGFEGTSTRDIAAEASSNIGSIAYHFGSKEGLRIACAEHIVQLMQNVAGALLNQSVVTVRPEQARVQLTLIMENLVNIVVARPQADSIIQFVIRELSHPTVALDLLYKGVLEPLNARLCGIWETATGEPAESDEAKLTVFSLIGQVVYFRIGREIILRRMGWNAFSQDSVAKVSATVQGNLNAILATRDKAKN